MTTRKSRKQNITEFVKKYLPKHHPSVEESLESLIYKWWFTARTGAGLRLTDEGMTCFFAAEISHYDFIIDKKDKSNDFKPEKFVLELNKKIDCPYYLGVKKQDKTNQTYIRLYDHKIAMMLSLYGSITDYLNSIGEK